MEKEEFKRKKLEKILKSQISDILNLGYVDDLKLYFDEKGCLDYIQCDSKRLHYKCNGRPGDTLYHSFDSIRNNYYGKMPNTPKYDGANYEYGARNIKAHLGQNSIDIEYITPYSVNKTYVDYYQNEKFPTVEGSIRVSNQRFSENNISINESVYDNNFNNFKFAHGEIPFDNAFFKFHVKQNLRLLDNRFPLLPSGLSDEWLKIPAPSDTYTYIGHIVEKNVKVSESAYSDKVGIIVYDNNNECWVEDLEVYTEVDHLQNGVFLAEREFLTDLERNNKILNDSVSM